MVMVKTYIPKIALLQSEINLIKTTVQKYLPESKVIIFGSRVLGTAKKFSDIDIAISNETKIKLEDLLNIKQEISDNCEYLIDLIDTKSVSNNFLEVILSTGVKI
jgi:uncharacterized protein